MDIAVEVILLTTVPDPHLGQGALVEGMLKIAVLIGEYPILQPALLALGFICFRLHY